jgi:aminodeoxyfutalosine deaminase
VSIDPCVTAFVRATPKVELHLHLIGSANADTVASLAERNASSSVPADPAALRAMFEFTDFAHFIEVYSTVNALVTDAQSIVDLIDGSARDLAAQNVRYAEMTITPYSHVIGGGVAYGDVLEALAEGRRLARRRGVEFAWVYDVAGEMGPAATQFTLDVALNEPPEGLVAFGLSGIEAGVDRARYADTFDRARAAGLRSVPHAGEGDGPASVWAALGFLRADRIGHGVRAIEDPRLVEHLAQHRVPLEVCPSSNICTRVYPTLADHPIRRLVDADVIVTINTDDPPMFSTSLNDEYLRVADTFHLDLDDIAKLVANGVRSSFMDAGSRDALLREVAAAAAACSS